MGAAKESQLRQKGVLDLKTYIPLRRLTNGLQICFVLTEALLDLAFPSEVYTDPIFSRLCEIANDIGWLANVSFIHTFTVANLTMFRICTLIT
jgi:hypothetical protein